MTRTLLYVLTVLIFLSNLLFAQNKSLRVVNVSQILNAPHSNEVSIKFIYYIGA